MVRRSRRRGEADGEESAGTRTRLDLLYLLLTNNMTNGTEEWVETCLEQ